MNRARIIPVLLLTSGGLYKSEKFKKYKYIGDPINAVKIFNEKEVDELVLLDIDSTRNGTEPNISRLQDIASEAFMPIAYGGGISSVRQIKQIINAGIEKVVLNTAAIERPELVSEAAAEIGSSSVVVSIDYKTDWLGKTKVFTHGGSKRINADIVDIARLMENSGAGEIILTSIERDGTFKGFDLPMAKLLASALSIPLIICGGASSIRDFQPAFDAGASAVAAGSMFVYQGPHRAVLINYPSEQLKKEFLTKIS